MEIYSFEVEEYHRELDKIDNNPKLTDQQIKKKVSKLQIDPRAKQMYMGFERVRGKEKPLIGVRHSGKCIRRYFFSSMESNTTSLGQMNISVFVQKMEQIGC